MKRTPLNMRQKQLLWDKQKGLCRSCYEPLKADSFEDDHHLALIDGGTNELQNRRLICIPCHKAKSALEHKANSKAKRLKYGRTRKSRPMDGSRDSPLKKHMDGSVSRR
jgi:5-methylcytosine-specific restriction endonuclease McrA